MSEAQEPWPQNGRLAMVMSPESEWEGCLALVTASGSAHFLVYVAEEDGPRHTDYLAAFDEAALVEREGLVWLEPGEDVRLEAAIFGLRQHWLEQAERPTLPWWRRR